MSLWSSYVSAIDAASSSVAGPSLSSTERAHGSLRWKGVWSSPVEIHRLAGLDRNIYAVARCVGSEVSGSGEAILSVAECIRNEAARRGIEPYTLLTHATRAEYSWTRGYYGEQHGRWAATSRNPTQKSLAAARAALQHGTRLVGDGARWISLRVMDAGLQGGRKLNYDAHSIVDKWGAEGWRWVGLLPRVDTYRHCCFRQLSGKQDNADLHKIVDAGRANRSVTPPATDKASSEDGLLLTGGAALALLAL